MESHVQIWYLEYADWGPKRSSESSQPGHIIMNCKMGEFWIAWIRNAVGIRDLRTDLVGKDLL